MAALVVVVVLALVAVVGAGTAATADVGTVKPGASALSGDGAALEPQPASPSAATAASPAGRKRSSSEGLPLRITGL